MSYIQDMKSLEHQHYLLAGLFFAATLAPGFLIIFHFRPELVERYDFFKLLLLSMSLTVPYLLINATQISSTGLFDQHGRTGHKAGLGMACFSSFYVLFVALLIAYYFDYSFRKFTVHVLLLTVLSYLILWLTARAERKKSSKQENGDL